MAIMKIAFVGTHGTGKTTLCYELAAWMKKREARVDMVREIARRCPLPINQDTTLEAQSWILHRQIAEEIQTASEQDVVICDRSVLDNYAYLTHRLGPLAPLDELVRYWMKTYSHLFKVPIVSAPAFDGTRDTSAAFQRAIDEEVDGLIERFGIKVYQLAPEDRSAAPVDRRGAPEGGGAASGGGRGAPEGGRAAPEGGRAAPEGGRAASEGGRAASEDHRVAAADPKEQKSAPQNGDDALEGQGIAPQDGEVAPREHYIAPVERGGWIDIVAREIGVPPKPPQIGLFAEEADLRK